MVLTPGTNIGARVTANPVQQQPSESSPTTLTAQVTGLCDPRPPSSKRWTIGLLEKKFFSHTSRL